MSRIKISQIANLSDNGSSLLYKGQPIQSDSGVDIDDASTSSTTTTWSANKINTELATKANMSSIPTTLSTLTDDSTHRLVTDAEKTKLAGIAEGANNYIHPATHTISEITDLPTALDAKEPSITAGTASQYLKGDKTLGTFQTDVRASLSGTSPISYTSSTGAIALNTVTVAKGGTNITSFAQGDLIYASAGTTLSKLAKSTTANSFLKNSGTNNNPAWATITPTDIGLANVTNVAQMPLSYLDTDSALTADSDTKVPSQKAIKAYITSHSGGVSINDSSTTSTTETWSASKIYTEIGNISATLTAINGE